LKSIDLGCGDERYKRSWCQSHIELSDIIFPLSRRAVPLATGYRVWCDFKRLVRSNEKLWSYFRKLRMKRARLLSR